MRKPIFMTACTGLVLAAGMLLSGCSQDVPQENKSVTQATPPADTKMQSATTDTAKPDMGKATGTEATPADTKMAAGTEGAKSDSKMSKDEKYITTASGLKYYDIKVGTGPSPKTTDTVTVNYVGTLTDGKKFDASADHGGAISFPLNGVIKGWTEGVSTMKVGGKRKLVCPPDLAYGANPPSPDIPPNATLVFEVELLKIGQ